MNHSDRDLASSTNHEYPGYRVTRLPSEPGYVQLGRLGYLDLAPMTIDVGPHGFYQAPAHKPTGKKREYAKRATSNVTPELRKAELDEYIRRNSLK